MHYFLPRHVNVHGPQAQSEMTSAQKTEGAVVSVAASWITGSKEAGSVSGTVKGTNWPLTNTF